jgi:Na+/H+ antiporter NhaC
MALGMESPPGFIALATSASVLSGSVWGDHCSPISDTTVLSSTGSGCDHDAHVKTQMPYAIVVGIIAVLLGTLPAGFGVPWYILLPLGTAACAAAVWGLGRLPTSSSPSPTSAPIDSDPSSHPALP